MRPIRTAEQRATHNKRIEDKQNNLLLLSTISMFFVMILDRIPITNLLILVPMVLIAVFFPVSILWVMVLSFYKDDGMYEDYEIRRYEEAKRHGGLNEDGTYKDHVL